MKTYTGANIKSELLVDISSATKSIDSFVSSANAKLQTLGNSLSKDLNLTGMKSLFGTTQLKDFNSQLKSTTTAMTNHNNSVNKVNNQYTQLKSSLKQTGQQMSTVTSETNKSASANNNLVGQLQQNVATYMQFYAVLQQVRNALSVHQEIDKSLTETRKVAGLTKEEMRAYQQETIGVANSLGVLQTDLIDATTEFVRLGHAFEDAKELGEIATIGARVGDIASTDTVSDYLISTIAGFEELEMTVDGATTVVDKFNNVANNTSINFQAIGEGVKRFASSMSTANNSLDESISLLVAGYDVTRDAPKVANALNTISMRLRGVTEDGEEVAELIPEIDDVLGKYGLTMEKVGEDGTKALKSTFEILGEISEIWDYLSDMDKSEIIEAVAGIRQSNVASAILSNWESVQKTMELVGNSAGSASNEYGMYMDSMEASTNQLKNAVNALYQHIASSDEMISLINTFTSFIEVLTAVPPQIYKMIAIYASLSAGTYAVSQVVMVLSKGLSALKAIMTGTALATGTLSASLMGIAPLVGVAVYALVELFGWLDKVTSKEEQLIGRQNELDERISASEVAFNGMSQAVSATTTVLDEYGNAVQKINEVEFYKHIDDLKEQFPELRDEINRVISTMTDYGEATEEVQDIVNRKLAEEQLEIINNQISANEDLIKSRQRLAETIEEERKDLNQLMSDYPKYADDIERVKFSIDDKRQVLAEMDAELLNVKVSLEQNIALIESYGFSLVEVNGQLQLVIPEVERFGQVIDITDSVLQNAIQGVYDLNTAEGVLAQAMIELSACGEISAGTLSLLQERFDENTVASFTSADAIISFSNANNLATVQIVKDNNTWIKSSQAKIQQALQEMRVLKQQADANLKYVNSIGQAKYDRLYDKGFDPALSDGQSQSSSYYQNLSSQLANDIALAESQLEYYDNITATLNQLSVPVSNSGGGGYKKPSSSGSGGSKGNSSSGSGGSSGSSSSSSSKELEEKVNYSEKFADNLRKIADTEHEIAKIKANIDYGQTDKETLNLLNQMVNKQRILTEQLKEYQNVLTQELNTVQRGSEEYYELQDMIRDVELQILSTTEAQKSYNNEIYKLKKEIEDFDVSKLDYELKVLEKAFDDESKSMIEREEIANKMIDKYNSQAKEIKDVINLLKDQQKHYNENSSEWRDLQEKIWDYELDLLDIESKKSDIIQDINDELLKVQEEYVDKQIDLINKELDAKLEALDAEKKALEDAKKEKEEAEKRQNILNEIGDIQKEMNSLSQDDSLWAKKRLYELQKALEEKEKELKDMEEQTEYEKKLAEIEERKTELQEEANKKIEALETALEKTADEFSKATTNFTDSLGGVLNQFMINLNAVLGSRSLSSSAMVTSGGSTSNTFNVSINANSNSSGARLANDFISALQSKGYKI